MPTKPLAAAAATDPSVRDAENAPHCDILLVGGGLANGLIALRLRQLRPDWHVVLLEAGAQLGGNHTWSFHAGDLTAAQHEWVAPLVAYRWPAYEVAFRHRQRRLASGYASITSERFDAVLRETLARPAEAQVDGVKAASLPGVMTGAAVASVSPRSVVLHDGRVLRAGAVIDGRGPSSLVDGAARFFHLGWQKFVGQELRLAAPHGLDAPLLMDARIPQRGGYRFTYVLPFSANTVLVEDTCYADDGDLDVSGLRADIGRYTDSRGWVVSEILREETGVLPITMNGDAKAFWRAAAGQPLSGMAAGLFHPATGYSVPDAVRLADRIASMESPPTAEALFKVIRDHSLGVWRSQGYYRLLNRMLFQAAKPDARWSVMQRFYGLSEPLIARFYAGRLNWRDKLRILIGKPPVPIGAAWRSAWARGGIGRGASGQLGGDVGSSPGGLRHSASESSSAAAGSADAAASRISTSSSSSSSPP